MNKNKELEGCILNPTMVVISEASIISGGN
jgi:hypothetical protein